MIVVFNILLPMILSFFARSEGVVSKSTLRSMVLEKFFSFTIFSVIVIPTVICGGLGKVAELQAKFAKDAFGQTLALAVELTAPKTSLYIGYMMQMGIIASGVLLLQVGPLIVGRIKRKMAVTPFQRRLALTPPEFKYHLVYPVLLLVLAMNLLFCITMPITVPFGVLFFACKHISDKYYITQCCQTARASDGSMPRSCLKILLMIVVIFQVATVGMLLGKRAVAQGIIAAVFSVFSVFFVIKGVNGKLEAIFAHDLFIEDVEARALAEAEAREIAEDMAEDAKKNTPDEDGAQKEQKTNNDQEKNNNDEEKIINNNNTLPSLPPLVDTNNKDYKTVGEQGSSTKAKVDKAKVKAMRQNPIATRKKITADDPLAITAKNLAKAYVNPGLLEPSAPGLDAVHDHVVITTAAVASLESLV